MYYRSSHSYLSCGLMLKTYEQKIGSFTVLTLVTGPFRENCYLVCHEEGETVLIDPGDEPSEIAKVIDDRGGRLDGLLLTHAHFDHIGAVATLCEKYLVSCQVHNADARLMRRAPFYAIRFVKQKFEVPKTVEYFSGNDLLKFGSLEFKVVNTPGHTQGSSSLYIEGAVFTGDTLFHKHIGPTNYPESEPVKLIESIDQLLSELPATTIIFPGHGKPWTVGEATNWWTAMRTSAPTYHIGQEISQ